ncbi:MAG: hypothetical protein NTY53_04580, partial [Kiritimatiellaeota bacterium]|nr:hypothetical protein [Kiritimatiellota bacterium]
MSLNRFPMIGIQNGCFLQSLENLAITFSNAWKLVHKTLTSAQLASRPIRDLARISFPFVILDCESHNHAEHRQSNERVSLAGACGQTGDQRSQGCLIRELVSSPGLSAKMRKHSRRYFQELQLSVGRRTPLRFCPQNFLKIAPHQPIVQILHVGQHACCPTDISAPTFAKAGQCCLPRSSAQTEQLCRVNPFRSKNGDDLFHIYSVFTQSV